MTSKSKLYLDIKLEGETKCFLFVTPKKWQFSVRKTNGIGTYAKEKYDGEFNVISG